MSQDWPPPISEVPQAGSTPGPQVPAARPARAMAETYDPAEADAAQASPARAFVEADPTTGQSSQIATLPPQPRTGATGYPISDRTGEPRRPVVLGFAAALLLTGPLFAVAGYLQSWWQAATITGYHSAARILEWVQPEPVSFLTIVMVILLGVIVTAAVVAPTAVAFNAWNGHRWTRIGGLVALAVTGLTLLLNDLASLALIPVAIGAALLWLPQVGRYFAAWEPLRRPQTAQPHFAEQVRYGTLPRYQ